MSLTSWLANRWISKELKKLREGNVKMVSSILAKIVKDIAEGKYGQKPKDWYWWAAGKKTLIALGIAAFYGVAQVGLSIFAQCVPECGSQQAVDQLAGAVAWIPRIVTVLIAVGLFDAAVRLEPPKK